MVDSIVMVLEPSGISFYRGRQLTQWMPIPGWRPMLRDARGRLMIEQNSFRAYVARRYLHGNLGSAPVMSCGEVAVPGRSTAAARSSHRNETIHRAGPGLFLSSATLPKFQLAAGLDGRTRVYDKRAARSERSERVGKRHRAVENGCGAWSWPRNWRRRVRRIPFRLMK